MFADRHVLVIFCARGCIVVAEGWLWVAGGEVNMDTKPGLYPGLWSDNEPDNGGPVWGRQSEECAFVRGEDNITRAPRLHDGSCKRKNHCLCMAGAPGPFYDAAYVSRFQIKGVLFPSILLRAPFLVPDWCGFALLFCGVLLCSALLWFSVISALLCSSAVFCSVLLCFGFL